MNRLGQLAHSSLIVYLFSSFINLWPYQPAVNWISESLGILVLCTWILVHNFIQRSQPVFIDRLSLGIFGIVCLGVFYQIFRVNYYHHGNLSWILFFLIAGLLQILIISDLSKEDLKSFLIKSLFLLGIVQLVFCSMEILGFVSAYVDWSQHQSLWVPHLPKIDFISGTMFQRNHLGSVLIIFMLATFALYSQAKLSKWATLFFIFLAAFFLMKTGSRGVILTTVSILILNFLRFFIFGKGKLLVTIFTFFTMLAISMQVVYYFAAPSFNQRTDISTIHRLKETSKAEIRWTLWAQSWDLISQKPVWGHGIGNFANERNENQAFYPLAADVSLHSEMFSHSHMWALQLLIEHGILIGGILILLLLGLILKSFFHSVNRDVDWCLWLGGWVIFVHSWTEYPLWYLSFFVLMLLILVLLLPEDFRKMKISFYSRWAICAGSFVIILATLWTSYQYTGLVETYYQKSVDEVKRVESVPGQNNPMLEPMADFYFFVMKTDLSSKDIKNKLSLCHKIKQYRPVEIVYFKCAILHTLNDDIPSALDDLQAAFHVYPQAATKMYSWIKTMPIEKNPRLEILEFRLKQMLVF